eukprot:237773-Amphidinium_carterae.1
MPAEHRSGKSLHMTLETDLQKHSKMLGAFIQHHFACCCLLLGEKVVTDKVLPARMAGARRISQSIQA